MANKKKLLNFSENFEKDFLNSDKFVKRESFTDFKKNSFLPPEGFDSIDELPDLHDPLSELNLFLSQKIKQEMRHLPICQKWTLKLQEELIQRISPEFQKKFPQYRLGIAALKKTWEKIVYFSQQIQHEKEALTQEGKINIYFLIKENLRSSMNLKNVCPLHPYHFAHQIAVKMSECIATVDGTRPKLTDLTRLIWSVQKHLIPKYPIDLKIPSDEFDAIDKLIVKSILKITSNQTDISHTELMELVIQSLQWIKNLPKTISFENLQQLHPDLLEEQIAATVLEEPEIHSASIIQKVITHFQKIKELKISKNLDEIEFKSLQWSIQGDMICRWIHLNPESLLVKLICQNWKENKPYSFEKFVSEICQMYLKKYPSSTPFAQYIQSSALISFKYCWYHMFAKQDESSFDRFLLWHGKSLSFRFSGETTDQILNRLETLCKKMLPLVPFDRKRADFLLFSQKQEEPKENKGNT